MLCNYKAIFVHWDGGSALADYVVSIVFLHQLPKQASDSLFVSFSSISKFLQYLFYEYEFCPIFSCAECVKYNEGSVCCPVIAQNTRMLMAFAEFSVGCLATTIWHISTRNKKLSELLHIPEIHIQFSRLVAKSNSLCDTGGEIYLLSYTSVT